MKYRLQDLVDIMKLQDLLESIYNVTKIPSKIIDKDANLIAAAGWEKICAKFHRKHPISCMTCIENDKDLHAIINKNYTNKKYFVNKCVNGLIQIGTPIIINGDHIATIIHEQFLTIKPNFNFFKEQCKKFGYNEKEYMEAVKAIPIITLDRIKPAQTLIYELAEIIGEMGLKQLEQLTANERLKDNFKEITAINEQLIDAKKELDINYKKILQYEKVKTDFFANISHELRTPLNLILSALQSSKLVIEKETIECANKSKLLKYNTIMKQNSYRLIRLVNNLIDITKIDSDYMKLEPKNCNIVSIIEEITLSTAQFIENNGMELIFDTDVEEKIMACDPDKIERIILNLLSNAVKFSNPGDKIKVNLEDKLNSIIITVEDTGIGIPEEKQSILFNRFAQVDKSLSRKTEGSGIGLTIVKSLVEMHNGTIKLESVYGQGTKFIITLPVNKLDEQEVLPQALSEVCCSSKDDKIQKINIEFSDIY